MNILQVQDRLKGLSEQQLAQEMQMPSGMAPQFLVLSELQRRKRVRDDFQAQQGLGQMTTVAQDAVAAAGVPQAPMAQMATAMAPQTDIAQNTGIASLPVAPAAAPEEPQRMAGGGMVRKMQTGRAVTTYPQEALMDNALIAMANRQGMSVADFLNSIDPQQAAGFAQSAVDRARRERFMPMEPVGEGVLFPTQEDLDRRYEEASQREPIFPNPGFSPDPPEDMRGPTAGYSPVTRPMPRPPATMDYRSQAIADATARGGRSGMVDAAIASGTPINPTYLLPPDPNMSYPDASPTERMVLAGLEDPIFPGAAAATELNRPPFRVPVDAGAGFATGLRDDALAGPQYAPAFEETGRSAPFVPTPVAPGPSFEQVGREVGAASPMDMANTAQALYEMDPATAYQDRVDRTRHIMDQMAAERARRNAPKSARQQAYEAAQADNAFDPLANAVDYFTRTTEEQNAINAANAAAEAEADPMYDAAKASAEEAARLRDEAGITESLKTPEEVKAAAEAAKKAAADNRTPVADDTPDGGGSGSGGIGGSGGMTSYEQAIADAIARADKRANQDKWLALAQAGMALMSSKQPTLGGALGEAGATGLAAFRQSRDEAEKTKMDLLGTQFEIDLARQKLAASGGGGGLTAYQMYQMDRNARSDELDRVKALQEYAAGLDPSSAEYLDIQAALSDYYMGGSGAGANNYRTPSAG